MKKAWIGLAALTLSVFASCGGLEKDSTYESVDSLRAAYEKAGGSCPQWQQSNQITAATESGTCDDNTVLSIYSNRTEALESAEATYEVVGSTPNDLLVGPNWVINTEEDLTEFQTQLGGQIITPPDPEPEAEPDLGSPDEDLVANAEAFREVAILEVPALASEDASIVYAAAYGGVCPALFHGKQLAKDVLSDGPFTSASLSDSELESFIRVSAEELCPENLGNL